MSAPKEADLQRWRRLIKVAGAVAKSPQSQLKQLDRAALRAKTAVMPVGHRGFDSPFNQLFGVASRWLVATPEARENIAHELGRLAKTCAEILTTPKAERRLRADVDN